jgi:hypothetical protein
MGAQFCGFIQISPPKDFSDVLDTYFWYPLLIGIINERMGIRNYEITLG